MYTLLVTSHFDAAHRLNGYKGNCQRIHGHRWGVLVNIEGEKLNSWGALIDFKEIKKYVNNFIEKRYDHKLILKQEGEKNLEMKLALPDEWICWTLKNPTAEFIAEEIYMGLFPWFKYRNIELKNIVVFETPDNGVKYEPSPKRRFFRLGKKL